VNIGTRLAVSLTAVCLTVSGCSGDPQPRASGSSSAPTTSAASSPPSTTSSPTASTSRSGSSSPGVDPNIPAAARAHTQKGAEAFARYYVEQINSLNQHPEKGKLERLFKSSCGSCKNFAGSIDYLVDHDQHYTGPIFRILSVESGAENENGFADVFVAADQLPINIVSSSGAVVDTTKPLGGILVVALTWESRGWEITAAAIDTKKVKP